MGQAGVVRSVPSIGPQVCAFQTSRLSAVGGLAAVSEDSLDELCAALIRDAHARGLRVLHTPYAVATLRTSAHHYRPQQGPHAPADLVVNRNLEGFPDVSVILSTGVN
jgi:hypothetical protein